MVVIEAGDALLVLRHSGSAPASTLVVDGAVLASTLGEGPPAWPLARARAGARLGPDRCGGPGPRLERSSARARGCGRSLSLAPALGPRLARELDGSAESVDALRERLRGARPTLDRPRTRRGVDRCRCWPMGAVMLLPMRRARPRARSFIPDSWIVRGQRSSSARASAVAVSRDERRRRLDEARRTVRRLRQAPGPSRGRPRRDGGSLGVEAPGRGACSRRRPDQPNVRRGSYGSGPVRGGRRPSPSASTRDCPTPGMPSASSRRRGASNARAGRWKGVSA